MLRSTATYATLDEWVAREAIGFALDEPATLHAAVDRLIAALGHGVDVLGFGEALHGSEELLSLRNRIFQHLVQAHGYSAIALETSFPRAHLVNEYVAGRGAVSYEALQDEGFSYGFRRLAANRELVEWMRHYNAAPDHPIKLRLYGFDSPTDMVGTDSPRQLLSFALAYLAALDAASGRVYRERIDALLGADAAWENPAAMMDPDQAIGLSPAASALRIATEDLITELRIRRPELVARSDADRYAEALRYAALGRDLLSYHAGLAYAGEHRIARLLGMRDAMMADNVAYMVARERGRGAVLAFAHNRHLQRGQAHWQLGAQQHSWWPAGAQLDQRFGPRYAVIGSGLGRAANGIAPPEPGTLEAVLARGREQALFVPTQRGVGLPAAALAALPVRSGSSANTTYMPLGPESVSDFDWLVIL